MSEYSFVEKPFLDQLKALKWDIIEHPQGVIPNDPGISLREDFRQVVLKGVFFEYVRKINLTEDGREWLTDKQLEELYAQVTENQYLNLLEANQNFYDLLQNKATVLKNELTGEEHPKVQLVDFDDYKNNSFIAINQFRVNTPGTAKNCIIPDIVLFVNGMPFVVIECKYTNDFTADPMEEGITQLFRYSNRRDSQEREGEERLFHFNQFIVSSWGDDARVGTITSDYDHFLAWKDIYPLKYKEYEKPLGRERSQEMLIQGMLPPETLLDIVRHFIIFMQVKKKTVKVVCRYQQYRAALKSIDRLLTGETPQERSGVVWHTQGSGKSLTMVFLIRKIRTTKCLSDYKVMVLNDRTDLEEQLGDTMFLTDEPVDRVENIKELREKLTSDSSNLVMVMTQKFQGEKSKKTDKLNNILSSLGVPVDMLLKQHKELGEINRSEKILMLIDEAHRSQSGKTFGPNMIAAFPHATKIAFTGTPLITDRHTKKTIDIFGGTYIDHYKLKDAVADGATVNILYIGKTTKTEIDDKNVFDIEFEDLFANRTPQEMELIKKKYGALEDIFEAENRIQKIADDIVKHYTDYILENKFKAQVVATSQLAAVRYEKALERALANRIQFEKSKPEPDEETIKQLEFLKVVTIISGEGTNEKPEITQARKKARSLDAVENFKKSFDYEVPNTGVAFLVVCDMLLTGFDAPIEQVMYVDRKMREHTLLQAIARVNRTSSNKKCGYIVDYIGISDHLEEALEIYGGDEHDDTVGAMKDITTEVPILRSRYQRLLDLFSNRGVHNIKDYVEYKITDPKTEYETLERCVELLEDEKVRAEFHVNLKKFLQSLDIIIPNIAANEFLPMAKAFGHIHNVSRQRYKDTSINLMGVGEKVKKLINKHLIAIGIDPKIEVVELFSPEFSAQLDKNPSVKAKASEMEHAIRKHCKVNFESDPALYKYFSDKLQAILDAYELDVNEKYRQLSLLTEEMKEGRKSKDPVDKFVGLLQMKLQNAGKPVDYPEDILDKIRNIMSAIVAKLRETIYIVDFWSPSKARERERLMGEIDDLLLSSGIIDIIDIKEQLSSEFINLAKHNHHELLRDEEV